MLFGAEPTRRTIALRPGFPQAIIKARRQDLASNARLQKNSVSAWDMTTSANTAVEERRRSPTLTAISGRSNFPIVFTRSRWGGKDDEKRYVRTQGEIRGRTTERSLCGDAGGYAPLLLDRLDRLWFRTVAARELSLGSTGPRRGKDRADSEFDGRRSNGTACVAIRAVDVRAVSEFVRSRVHWGSGKL